MKFSNVQKQFALLLAMFIGAVYFWDSFIIYPIKLFVVLLHEMSHGIAAVLLGGKIDAIQLSSKIGGYCSYSIAPSTVKELVISSAGYLGSIFWGGIILISASKVKRDRYISLMIGIIVLILSFYVIRTGEIFGILFCFIMSILLILSYRYMQDGFHDYLLKFVGLTSCLYVIVDIKNDLIDRSGVGSDADRIAQLVGIPSVVTGIFWAALACIMLFYFLKISFKVKEESNDDLQSTDNNDDYRNYKL